MKKCYFKRTVLVRVKRCFRHFGSFYQKDFRQNLSSLHFKDLKYLEVLIPPPYLWILVGWQSDK